MLKAAGISLPDFFRLTLILIIVFPLSCKRSVEGEGEYRSESRQFDHYDRIGLYIPANVTIVIADSAGFLVTAQDNILKAISTGIDGDELEIRSDYSLESDKPIEIVITTPSLQGILVNGSGNVKMLNSIKGESMKLYINGSGEIRALIQTSELRSQLNGSGEIFVKGSSEVHQCEVNGSGNLHALELNTGETEIEVNGSGNADVNASDELDAAIHGSGNIIYRGTPHLKSEITGSGSIKKEN